jgi:MFS family permease
MISFFPALAESKGMDQSIIGVLFGLDPLIGLPASILTGRLMFKLGRKKVFIFGIFCSAVGFTLLSTIHYFRNDVACLLAFSARVVSGLGTATYMTAGQSLLLNQCPEQAESLVAKFEAVGGLGFLVGPVVGFFFSSSQVGCFGICGLLLFVYGLVNLLLLEVHENVDEQGEDYGISGFIKKPVRGI